MENLKGKKNIKLYHGSDVIVGQPEYGKGKLNKIFRKYFGRKCVILISDKRK